MYDVCEKEMYKLINLKLNPSLTKLIMWRIVSATNNAKACENMTNTFDWILYFYELITTFDINFSFYFTCSSPNVIHGLLKFIS